MKCKKKHKTSLATLYNCYLCNTFIDSLNKPRLLYKKRLVTTTAFVFYLNKTTH